MLHSVQGSGKSTSTKPVEGFGNLLARTSSSALEYCDGFGQALVPTLLRSSNVSGLLDATVLGHAFHLLSSSNAVVV